MVLCAMKLYSDINGDAPSPRRVRVFLAEKGIDVDLVRLRIHDENRTKDFAAKNPMRTLPVLELDDGTCISESIAICRYFEQLSPNPSLFGTSPLVVAMIEMWNRRAEFSFYMPIEFAGGFLGEEVTKNAQNRVARTAKVFDEQLRMSEFLAGNDISVADITAKVALDFGVKFNEITIDQSLQNFHRWNAMMENRDSARA
jgi:glutathione S-transferase